MSNVVRNAAIIAGLMMTAAGGTALYVAGLPPHAPAATAPVQNAVSMAAPAPAPATPAAAPAAPAAQPNGPVPYAALQSAPPQQDALALPPPPQDAAQDPTVWPDGVASERFATFVRPFTFIRDSAAYAAASGDSPQLYPLRAGTAVASAERSTDGKWVIAMTEDGKAAFLLTADLGPYDPSKAPQPDAPQIISGAAQVIDTGLLDVGGQQVALSGVVGEKGIYIAKMQGMINAHGQQVTCTPAGNAYQCKLTDGLDPARAALFNGAAAPAADASADYQTQSQVAKTAHRGIWN